MGILHSYLNAYVSCFLQTWKAHAAACQQVPKTAAQGLSDAAQVPRQSKGRTAESSLSQLLKVMKDTIKLQAMPSVFREALTEEGFSRAAYPGVSQADLPAHLPRTLGQLLRENRYASTASSLACAAFNKAETILSAVKARGAAAGDVMDSTTEAALWPSIFAEALARCTPTAMDGLARATHSSLADDDAMLASPLHVLAAANQVRSSTLAGLAGRGGPGYAVQTGPFGIPDDGEAGGDGGADDDAAEWTALVLEDCLRFAEVEAGRMSQPVVRRTDACVRTPDGSDAPSPATALPLAITSSASCCWVDAGASAMATLENEYPALHEAIQRMQALPYELNRKVPALRLVQPCPGMTLLKHYRVAVAPVEPTPGLEGDVPSASDALRLILEGSDGNTTSTAASPAASGSGIDSSGDSGYKVTVTYTIGCSSSGGAGGGSTGSAVGSPIRLRMLLNQHHDASSAGGGFDLADGNKLVFHRSRALQPVVAATVIPFAAAAGVERSSTVDCFTVTFFAHGRDDNFG